MVTVKKTARLLFVFALAALGLILTTSIAAAINAPDELSINHVWVYRNCIEPGDQIYIVDFTVDYAVNPTENADDAYVCRLMNGTTELAAVTPYVYFDDGYDRGVLSFYFNTDEAPSWAGSYTIELFGNPLLAWAPAIPELSTSSFDIWQDNDIVITRQLISSRILWLAQEVSDTWDTTYSLLEFASTGNYLSSEGQEYFTNVIDNFSTIAPFSLADRTIPLDADTQSYTQDYAGDLETGIAGTALDLTDLGNVFGLDRGVITALLYYACVITFMVLAVRQIGDYKPILLFSLPLVSLGAFLGVPLLITVMVGFIALIMTAYALFYSHSGA